LAVAPPFAATTPTVAALAEAAVMTLMLTSRAFAGDLFFSPRAAQLRNDFRTVPGTTPDMLDRAVKAGSPKALALAHDFRKLPGTTPDMLARNLPAAPPRLLANEPWRLQQFRVALLK
jgi:hypothetical protein